MTHLHTLGLIVYTKILCPGEVKHVRVYRTFEEKEFNCIVAKMLQLVSSLRDFDLMDQPNLYILNILLADVIDDLYQKSILYSC